MLKHINAIEENLNFIGSSIGVIDFSTSDTRISFHKFNSATALLDCKCIILLNARIINASFKCMPHFSVVNKVIIIHDYKVKTANGIGQSYDAIEIFMDNGSFSYTYTLGFHYDFTTPVYQRGAEVKDNG